MARIVFSTPDGTVNSLAGMPLVSPVPPDLPADVIEYTTARDSGVNRAVPVAQIISVRENSQERPGRLIRLVVVVENAFMKHPNPMTV
jgi:hypothetical protein